MSGISTTIISHEFKINTTIRTITPKRISQDKEKSLTVSQEVGKSLEVEFTREVCFQTWVAILTLVKKSNVCRLQGS